MIGTALYFAFIIALGLLLADLFRYLGRQAWIIWKSTANVRESHVNNESKQSRF